MRDKIKSNKNKNKNKNTKIEVNGGIGNMFKHYSA